MGFSCVDFGICMCTVWLFFDFERGSWSVSQTGLGLLLLLYVFFHLLPLHLTAWFWAGSFFMIFLELFVNINY